MTSFSRHERLLKRADFLRISRHGNKVHTSHFILLWTEPAVSAIRVGITVSGKVGNSVIRNRIKRLVREFYRLNKSLFFPADFSIIARQGADRLSFSEVSRELGRALHRIHTGQC